MIRNVYQERLNYKFPRISITNEVKLNIELKLTKYRKKFKVFCFVFHLLYLNLYMYIYPSQKIKYKVAKRINCLKQKQLIEMKANPLF